EHLPAADFDEVTQKVTAAIGRKPGHDEVLSYLMYPDVFLKFAKAQAAYGDVDILPTPQFFYGMQKGEEITIDIEPGKTLVVKFLAVSEPHPDGTRTVFFEINGQPREVDIRDRSLQSSVAARVKADPGNPGQVGAPLPGLVTAVAVNQGATVKKGDKLLVIEAMKMQSTVYVPADGRVAKLVAQVGMQVEAKDLLAVIE
ncbi:MAG TPA: biotin/lipoyl-containing protein, partial [Bryobacteraceae bacterium]|nr:biotin/lipoyl-containing protein [Bryobacteraceae bacterium]